MRIAVIGTGYVGLVSGVCLAAKGHEVACVDLRDDIVASLNSGRPHIHERGLPELLRTAIGAGRFHATRDLAAALDGCELALVAVGTPSEAGIIDLRYVEAAVQQLGEWLRDTAAALTVVVKSTVVPGTTDTLVRGILERTSGRKLGEFGLGMNPEFLREGNAVEDFMQPDRIVLGYENPGALEQLERLYVPWAVDKLRVNTRTAELIKYANNALLAMQISATNEIANLAAALGGIDAMEVMRGVHLDRRWNPILPDGIRANPAILTYLVPGCGFGGSCFPKDVQALRSRGQTAGLPMRMLDATLAVNDAQPGQIVRLLRHQWPALAGRRVLVLGLAFKPETDDVRESASRKIIAALLTHGMEVTVHDPIAAANACREWPELSLNCTDDWPAGIAIADAVVVATRWPEYRKLCEASLSETLRGKMVVDARRFFSSEDFPTATYCAIGYTERAIS